jgi:hypothetical protein
MFRRDWSVKPNGEAFRDMVFREWWTDVRGAAAADGTYRVRGFHGRYEVEAAAGGHTRKMETTLGPQGRELTVSLD